MEGVKKNPQFNGANNKRFAPARGNSQEKFSSTRAIMALLLTGLTALIFGLGCYHVWWAITAFYYNRFGSNLNNAVIIVGGLALNAFVSIKTLVFLETRLLSNNIDADHKKYI